MTNYDRPLDPNDAPEGYVDVENRLEREGNQKRSYYRLVKA